MLFFFNMLNWNDRSLIIENDRYVKTTETNMKLIKINNINISKNEETRFDV